MTSVVRTIISFVKCAKRWLFSSQPLLTSKRGFCFVWKKRTHRNLPGFSSDERTRLARYGLEVCQEIQRRHRETRQIIGNDLWYTVHPFFGFFRSAFPLARVTTNPSTCGRSQNELTLIRLTWSAQVSSTVMSQTKSSDFFVYKFLLAAARGVGRGGFWVRGGHLLLPPQSTLSHRPP